MGSNEARKYGYYTCTSCKKRVGAYRDSLCFERKLCGRCIYNDGKGVVNTLPMTRQQHSVLQKHR